MHHLLALEEARLSLPRNLDDIGNFKPDPVIQHLLGLIKRHDAGSFVKDVALCIMIEPERDVLSQDEALVAGHRKEP